MKALLMMACLAGLMAGAQPEPAYSETDLYVLSHIISAEAGNCSEDMMLSVGSVVLNRVADDRFPDTIEEVVFQPGQYSPTWNGAYYAEPTEEAVEVAKTLLEEGSAIDSSVVWQAEFPQGQGIYDTIESPWGSVMFFCY